MKDVESLYRATLRCSRCGKGDIYAILQHPDRRIEATCLGCKTPEDNEVTAGYQTGIHIEWRLVAKARLHKLSEAHDRRGTIVTITLNDKQSGRDASIEAVKIAQGLMLLGGQYGIHRFGEDGEQNHVWVTLESFWGQAPIKIVINHKYIGDDEIEAIRDSVRLLAKRWKWELEDDTIDPLTALAKI